MIRVVLSSYSLEEILSNFFRQAICSVFDVEFQSDKGNKHYNLKIGKSIIISINALNKQDFFSSEYIIDFIFDNDELQKNEKIGYVFNMLLGMKIISICGSDL